MLRSKDISKGSAKLIFVTNVGIGTFVRRRCVRHLFSFSKGVFFLIIRENDNDDNKRKNEINISEISH